MAKNQRGIVVISLIIAVLVTSSASAAGPGTAPVYNIRDYGATGNGTTLDTAAINQAMTDCSAAGGGTVFVPAGTYLSGTIIFRDNVTLYLDNGALIKGSPDIAQYGGGEDVTQCLVSANRVKNIAIAGQGTLDGNGEAFMYMDRYKMVEPDTADYDTQYIRQGADYMNPAFGMEDGPVLPKDRPQPMFDFNRCTNVSMEDVTALNSPAWCVRVIDSDYVTIHGVDIINNPMIPNNDGYHVTTSRNVHISDCHFEGGDDAVIVTGFGNPDDVAENVTVTNCTFKTRSAGIRVGYGDSSVRNCVFENIVIYGSNRGIGVFVRDAGSVENILFNNITIETRLHKGHWWGNAEPIHVSVAPHTAETNVGQLRNVKFSNIVAHAEHGIVLHGYEDRNVQDVTLDNIRLYITNSPINDTYGGNFDLRPTSRLDIALYKHDIPALYCKYTDGVRISNLTVTWADGLPEFFSHGIQADNFRDLVIDGFTGRQAHSGDSRPVISLANGNMVTIRNCRADSGSGPFLGLTGMRNERLFVNNDLSDAHTAFVNGSGGFTLSGNIMPGR